MMTMKAKGEHRVFRKVKAIFNNINSQEGIDETIFTLIQSHGSEGPSIIEGDVTDLASF